MENSHFRVQDRLQIHHPRTELPSSIPLPTRALDLRLFLQRLQLWRDAELDFQHEGVVQCERHGILLPFPAPQGCSLISETQDSLGTTELELGGEEEEEI